jgi:FkbM family methyltransferase
MPERKGWLMSVVRAWFATENIRFRLRALKARLRDQKAELDVIRQHLRSGDTVCDVGANKGTFTYWLSRWCRDGRVFAFEPQPELARALANACHSIGLSNVKVEAKAVYSHSGNQDIFVPEGHQAGASLVQLAKEAASFTTLTVPVITLDEYFDAGERVALLKIDVEGAEFEVLKGAERILRQHAPLLVFEHEKRHVAPRDMRNLFSYLEGLGYEGSFVHRGRLLPVSEFDDEVHQRQDGEWFWKSKDYCNNFIFRKHK